jgi:hypothetical protein
MVVGEQLLPGAVAHLGRLRGGADDVGEKERGEHAVRLDLVPSTRQEALDLVEQCLAVALPRKVVAAGKLDDSRAGEQLAEELGPSAPAFARPVEHERRDGDRRKHAANVDADVHEPQRPARAGACAAPHVRRVPAQRRGVACDARGDPSEPVPCRGRRPVVFLQQGKAPAQILLADAIGVVRRLHLAREGPQQDEGGGSIGVGRGEQRRHRSPFRETDQDRPLGTDGVQHGTDVIHPRLQVGQMLGGDPIREAGAALVEEDESTHRRESPVERGQLRVLPARLERADPAVDEHEVERAVADDLVGDPDVGASGVGDVTRGIHTDGADVLWGRSGTRLAARVQLEGRVLLQHLPLELAQGRGRLDPELFVERPPEGLVARERLGLPTRTVEREHVLGAEALAERMLGDQRLQLSDDVAVMPERELGLDPQFDRSKSNLLEPCALVPAEGLGELGERGAAPERERVVQQLRRLQRVVLRERLARADDPPVEAREVELVVFDLEHVAGCTCVQSRLHERLPQLRHVDLHHLLRRFRDVLAPERVDELLSRDRVVRVQEENCKERPLLAGRDVHRGAVTQNL